MSLKVIYWDDPRLSTVCEEIPDSAFGPQLEEFGRQMILTMQAENGVGLAAPQVGELKRIFTMEIKGGSPIVAVNPIVTSYGEKVAHDEGCLSLPGFAGQVIRPRQVNLRYQHPLTAEWHEVELEDYEAFCAAHEDDHLSGIMFFDLRRMDKSLSKKLLKKYFTGTNGVWTRFRNASEEFNG